MDIKTETEHICQRPSCGKSLAGRPKQTRYCNAECRTAALTTKLDDNGEERELIISFGCQYPRAQQAEITPRWQGRRHPVHGDRPQWSGYCVIVECECPCHPEAT
jgi:hypothetical protein